MSLSYGYGQKSVAASNNTCHYAHILQLSNEKIIESNEEMNVMGGLVVRMSR
jgi:hypothetical protein